MYAHLLARSWTWLLALGVVASLVGIFRNLALRRELPAFLSSCALLISLLTATVAGLFPNLLTSSLTHANDITAFNAPAGGIGLQVGLFWWTGAMLLAVGYFAYLFYSFRGKVNLEHERHH